jgi:acetyl esterase/lipase
MVRRWFGLVVAILLLVGWKAGATPPIEAYGALPAVDMMALSPSGDRFAYVEADGEKRQLIVATIDKKPLVVQPLGTTKVRSLDWVGDDHIMVASSVTADLPFLAFEPKGELSAVVVFDLAHRKMIQVFGRAHEARIFNTVVGLYGTAQLDGHWYGYFGGVSRDINAGTPGFVELYRVDLDTGETSLASQYGAHPDNWVVNAHGNIIARSFHDARDGRWWLESLDEGGKVIAGGHFEFGGVGNIYPGRASDTILAELPIASAGDQPKGYLFQELSLSGAPIKDPVDTRLMTRPIFDPISSLWIGMATSDEAERIKMITPPLEQKWRGAAKAFPGYIVHLISHSADLNRMIVYTDGGDDSGTYWIVDTAARTADQLGRAHPLVKAADVGLVSEIEWRAADGLPLSGTLTLPPGRPAKSLPLIVLPHGGPEERDYRHFDWWAQAFAGRGYAVFQPNYRGSGDFGVAFRNAGFGEWGRKMQTDISDGVADLAGKGIIDPKRACIVGSNYGGYAALAGVTVQQGLYRCAVSVAGVADPEAILVRIRNRAWGTSPSLRYWKAYIGAGSTFASNNLDSISPVALAAKADAPILLIHGKDDTVVQISQSEAMESALKRAGKPVDFVVMENEDHWLSRGETRTEMLKSAVDFVEKYNPAN